MSAEMVPYDNFEFMGDRLPLLVDGAGQWVSFTRLCDVFGLEAKAEWSRVRMDDAFDGLTRVEYRKGGSAHSYIRTEAVYGWLFQLETARLAADLRPKHKAYKQGLFKAIADFVTKGVAVNRGVVGEDAARRIEAIAEQARAARLAECRQFYEIARRDMPDDAILMARAEQMVRQIISREAGASASRPSDEPDTVAGILGSVGVQWHDVWINRFGTPVANEYRRRYHRDPPSTNQFGRRSEPGTYSGRSIYPKCYPPGDWPWILEMARGYGRLHELPVPA